MILTGGLAPPLHRLGVVLRHADALAVYEAEHVLGAGVALLGKWSKLAQRRRISPARSQK